MSKLLKKLKLIIVFIITFIILGVVVYTNSFLFKKTSTLPSSKEISKNKISNKKENNMKNILLLGDSSDSMIVASINTENKNIELTPFMHTGCFDRSNMENLINTLEKNINMDIDKFIQIDLNKLINIVSILGDIPVDIKPDDLTCINNLIPKFYAEYENKNKGDMKLINSSGVQKLNEYQTMAYTTVISENKEKQKEVLTSIAKNFKNLDFTKYIELYNEIKPNMKTNLTITDMIELVSI